jgi:hypothetical protein
MGFKREETGAGMTSMSNTSMTLGEFERLLDIYGGDRTRWPTEARAAAAHLVARDGDARQLLAEAEALDRVLERAPLPTLATEAALADRIVAAAQRSPRIVAIGGAGPPRAEKAPGLPAVRPAAERPPIVKRKVRAAGLLVASLMLGVVIGRTSLPQQLLLPELAELAGLAPDDLTRLAQQEEDML